MPKVLVNKIFVKNLCTFNKGVFSGTFSLTFCMKTGRIVYKVPTNGHTYLPVCGYFGVTYLQNCVYCTNLCSSLHY